jgi:hypothetical protein
MEAEGAIGVTAKPPRDEEGAIGVTAKAPREEESAISDFTAKAP